MNSHAQSKTQQIYQSSVQSNWTAGGGAPAGGMNASHFSNNTQQQSSGRSYHSQQPYSQIPSQPMGGIHVPDDYEGQDNQAIQQQKEKFFESLGLPPNLQENTIKTYQPQILPHSSSGDTPLDDSSLFKSCNNPPSYSGGQGSYQMLPQTAGPVYSGAPSHQKTHPHHSSYKTAIQNMQAIPTSGQNIVSESSYLTAFDAGQSISQKTPGDKRYSEQIIGRVGSLPAIPSSSLSGGSAHFPPQSRHNDSVRDIPAPQNPQLEEIKRFEDLLVDSQRKLSAPVNFNHQRLSEVSQGHSTDFNSGSRMPSKHQQQQPMTFNNTLGGEQPYPQYSNHQQNQRPSEQHLGDNRREILTITVDIGSADGETANILIREGDDPVQLAEDFANKHGIMSEQLKELLAEQIKLNVEAVLVEEEEEYQRGQKQIQQQHPPSGQKDMMVGGYGVGGGSMDQRKPQEQQPTMLNKLSSGTLGNGVTHSDSSSRGPQGSNQFMQLHQVPLERQSYASSNNQNQANYTGVGPMSIHTTADALYYQNTQHQQTPGVNQSYNNLSNSYIRQSMQQRQNSYGRMPMVNSSFVSDGQQNPFGTMQNSQIFQYPGTQTYQQWKEQVSSQLRSHRANQPAINDNSKKIIEYKRQLNNTATMGNNSANRKSSVTVHQRLHQQAVSKQRQHINYNMPPPPQPNRINFVSGSTRNQTKQTFNLPAGSNTSSPTRPPRSSSVQDHHQNTNSTSLQPPRDLVNYGERLYQKGIKRKEEQLRMLKEVRTMKERDEIAKECKFHPEINQISRMIAHPLRGDGMKTEEALIKYGQQSREKLEQKRSEMLFQELAGCQFKPQLAARHTTEKILQGRFMTAGGYESDGAGDKSRGRAPTAPWRANSADKNGNPSGAYGFRSNSADKFRDLYQDAMRRRERQDKIYSACIGSECTFQPDTTVSKYYYQRLETRDPGYQSHKLQLEGSRYQQPTQSRGRHFRNLSEGISEKERLQRSLKKSSTFNNDLCDPDSGMPYFRPRVGRGPKNQQRPDPSKDKCGTAIMLYNQSKVLREKMDYKKRFLDQEKESNMKKVHTTERSKYIIEELKIAHFADLFRRLDSDGDGQISCQKIDLSLVEPELLGVLEQIFTEMEELGQSLSEEEWVDACCRLYEALPMPQKRMLFNPKEQRRGGQQSKQGKNASQYAYRPKLDSNSIRIAQQKRTGEDVADVLLRKRREYEQRILEKKQEKENMELVGCTFHPNIIQSPMSTGSNSAAKGAYSRVTEPNRPSVGQTMPGSRQSFSVNSIQGLPQNQGYVSRAPAAPGHLSYHTAGSVNGASQGIHMHNQSFHGGNTSQQTATFHAGARENTNNTQNSNPTSGFFDLNNLAYNVANEYLRPSSNGGGMNLPGVIGGTFDQHHSNGVSLIPQNNFYRAPSVNANDPYARIPQQRQ